MSENYEYVKHCMKLFFDNDFRRDIKKLRKKLYKELQNQYKEINPAPPIDYKNDIPKVYFKEIIGKNDFESENHNFLTYDFNPKIKQKDIVVGYKDNNDNNIYLDLVTNDFLIEMLEKWSPNLLTLKDLFVVPEFITTSNPLFTFISACCVFKVNSLKDISKIINTNDCYIIDQDSIKNVKNKLSKLKEIKKTLNNSETNLNDIKEIIENHNPYSNEEINPAFVYSSQIPSNQPKWIEIHRKLKSTYNDFNEKYGNTKDKNHLRKSKGIKKIKESKGVQTLLNKWIVYFSKVHNPSKKYKRIVKDNNIEMADPNKTLKRFYEELSIAPPTKINLVSIKE